MNDVIGTAQAGGWDTMPLKRTVFILFEGSTERVRCNEERRSD